MCKVIAVTNQKGGVGKTTTTANLGVGLAKKGKRVLLIDADPQGNLTSSLGYKSPDSIEYTLASVMMEVVNGENLKADDGILHNKENVDLMPSNIGLSGLEITLCNVMSREMVLRDYVEEMRERYDYILIDCMPGLGLLPINSLVAADAVLIPVQAADLAVQGLQQLIKTIAMVKKRLNRKLQIIQQFFESIMVTIFFTATMKLKLVFFP